MKKIAIGKFRGLQKISAENEVFSVLALDHRQNLRKSFNPNNPENVPDQKLIDLKKDILSGIKEGVTAFLLDPEVGSAQAVSAGVINGKNGLIVALEKTGYSGFATRRTSHILEGWGVKKAKISGADAVKLLVYYHPDSDTADSIENLVRKTATQCEKWQIPLMLEVLTYSIHADNLKLSGKNRQTAILQSVQRLSSLSIDMIKIEFPTDADAGNHEWSLACQAISKVSKVPWILLSAAVDFETYKHQVEIACIEGASGVAAGRAIWKEAVFLDSKSRREFLQTTAQARMVQIFEICRDKATPWSKFFEPIEITANWFKTM